MLFTPHLSPVRLAHLKNESNFLGLFNMTASGFFLDGHVCGSVPLKWSIWNNTGYGGWTRLRLLIDRIETAVNVESTKRGVLLNSQFRGRIKKQLCWQLINLNDFTGSNGQAISLYPPSSNTATVLKYGIHSNVIQCQHWGSSESENVLLYLEIKMWFQYNMDTN